MAAITAAVAGVVLNLAVWFAWHVAFGTVDEGSWGPIHWWIPDWSTVRWWSIAVAAASAVALFRLHWKVPRLLFVAGVAGAGLVMAGVAV